MQLLSRLNIRTKLAGIVVLAALTALAIIAASASLSRSRMIEDRVAQMREGVTLLMGVAQSLQEEVEAGKLTLADAQAQFKQLGHHMSLDNGLGYPFAYLPGPPEQRQSEARRCGLQHAELRRNAGLRSAFCCRRKAARWSTTFLVPARPFRFARWRTREPLRPGISF